MHLSSLSFLCHCNAVGVLPDAVVGRASVCSVALKFVPGVSCLSGLIVLAFDGYRFSRFILATPEEDPAQVDVNLNESWFQMYGTGNSMGVCVCCVMVLSACHVYSSFLKHLTDGCHLKMNLTAAEYLG